jgi:hypothetical protein
MSEDAPPEKVDAAKLLDGYMLDTTEFNAVAKGYVPISAFAGRRLFATHVQLDELDKTPCERLRAELRASFEEVAAESLPTESAVFDVSKWDKAKWPDNNSVFDKMLASLETREKTNEKRHQNRLSDLLIAETAIRNDLILVSGDANLRAVTIEFGGRAIERAQLS